MNQLDQYEKTYCDCHKCRLACRHMPGMLAPGDVDRIARFKGVDMEDPDQSEAFLRDHFQASDGAESVEQGEPLHISTIVPAQREDGNCVFLGPEGCTVHPAAPFGCSRFNVCDGPETVRDASRRSTAALDAISENLDYQFTWQWLKLQGRDARPLRERRAVLKQALSRNRA